MELENINNLGYKLIEADNLNYSYMGRIDFQNPKAPTIIYAGSTIKIKFSGKTLKIALKNYHNCYENAVGYIIDGVMGKAVIEEHNKDVILELKMI